MQSTLPGWLSYTTDCGTMPRSAAIGMGIGMPQSRCLRRTPWHKQRAIELAKFGNLE